MKPSSCTFRQGDSLGLCPCCRKGRILKGSSRWLCDHFELDGNVCGFTIFREYKGYGVTDEDVREIITNGHTGPREFLTHEGVPYTACLQLSGKRIRVTAVQEDYSMRCPHCGGRVRESTRGYVCENYSSAGSADCRFFLPKVVFGRQTTQGDAREILERGRTEVLDGFRYQDKTYSSCLVVGHDGSVQVDGQICRCPKCGGTVYAGVKGYYCSNFRNPSIRCDFGVWRVIGKVPIRIDDVRQLCSQGRTRIIRFQNMEGSCYEKALVLDPDFKVRMSD